MLTITLTTKERELLDLILRSITHGVRYHNRTAGHLLFDNIEVTWNNATTTIEVNEKAREPLHVD